MSNTVKTKFAGLLRSLLRRVDHDEPQLENRSTISSRPVASSAPQHSRPMAQEFNPAETQSAETSATATAVEMAPAVAVDETHLEIPLQSIVGAMSMELRARVVLTDLSSFVVSIPLETILSQLALGAVKITFGELRQAAADVFSPRNDQDAAMVILPLNEILARLNPALLNRRPMQKQVSVSDDVTSPFSAGAEGLSIAPPAPKTPLPTSRPSLRTLTSHVTPGRPGLPISAAPARQSLSGVPPLQPPAFAPRNGSGKSVTPVTPVPLSIPVQPETPEPTKPAPVAVRTISMPLASLVDGWPDALRLEIAQLTLENASLTLPMDLVEHGLKTGRVTFPWRQIRAWVHPAPPAVSIHDCIELDLPLKVLAPLFISRLGSSKAQQRVSVAPEIPNLFFGLPQPSSAPEPAQIKMAETNYFERFEAGRVTDTQFKRLPSPATDFTSRQSPPSDIVARAVALNGVVGALVALPDGLRVASQVPEEFNPDTLAAFLPQILERVNQCTRELRMGALNNVNFTVGNVPWKIFRVNAVYFAAFGRAGEQLPSAQLAQLAAELDRKK